MDNVSDTSNILILGNGAREMVIKEILEISGANVFYGNWNSLDEIETFINNSRYSSVYGKISLVIPSTEHYLHNGIVNRLNKINVPTFGPTKEQAQIESSKLFSKNLMKKLQIPTADFKYYKDFNSIFYDTDKVFKVPYREYVVKYSGLAQGKGVYIPEPSQNTEEVLVEINKIFEIGDEGILIEERLNGKEVSVLAFCNGIEANLMPQAQDYKRMYDGDIGPNTGGMGAVCPVNILNEEELSVVKKYMDSVVKELNYKGILYAGLMKTSRGVYFLEFNCRFGDPEAQVILNLLDSPLEDIFIACIKGHGLNIKWKKNRIAAAVILSHEDYPYKKLNNPVEVRYLPLDPTVKVYKSNIQFSGQKDYTTGGRVLSMVSVSGTLKDSLENIYNNIYKITYPGVFYRRDIGSNTLDIDTKQGKVPYIGILSSGNGTCIEKLLEQERSNVKIIITDKQDAGIIEKARKSLIPYMYFPKYGNVSKKEYYEKMVNILRQFDVELVILAGYMKIVSTVLFEEFETINIHPSLLPKYSGLKDLDVHREVLRNKDSFSGCTLHRVSVDIDGGRILLQKQCKVYDDDDPMSLKNSIQLLEGYSILQYVRCYSKTKVEYSVNINEGNRFIEELKKTNPMVGGFCAEFPYKGLRIAAAADGVGTKVNLAVKYNKLDTIGIDLVAMNVNDLIAGGAKPLFFMDYIALDNMNTTLCKSIIKGINRGCELANCKLIGGETAEMKGIYLKNKIDLAGFSIGEVLFDLPKLDKINDNCILYGIESSGIHSNGYTLINEIISKDDQSFPISEIMEPTRIYTEVLSLYEEYPENILAVSHITGGGFLDNLKRVLPDDLTFELENWEFPNVFKWIQDTSQLNRAEMLGTFNCGYGMVIVSNKELPLKKIGKVRSRFLQK